MAACPHSFIPMARLHESAMPAIFPATEINHRKMLVICAVVLIVLLDHFNEQSIVVLCSYNQCIPDSSDFCAPPNCSNNGIILRYPPL